MQEYLGLFRELAPEAIALLKQRYEILNAVHLTQPVGRRALADKLDLSERVLRRELDLMRAGGLLEVSAAGVSLTEKAEGHMLAAQSLLRVAMGLTNLEKDLLKKLGLAGVLIVPGDSDGDETVMLNMGRAAAGLIREKLHASSVIAVMGGRTVARVTGMVRGHYPGVTVVPARGGLGETVETQANTIAAKLAENLGGRYKLLHIPENLDPAALAALRSDARVKNVLSVIGEADILLYGIGTAEVMARRRGLAGRNIARLLTKGAVAEALGHYFNADGELVDKAPSFGIELSDQPHLALSLAVAGGKSKALAIVAALKRSKRQVLVTDEGAAISILTLLESGS